MQDLPPELQNWVKAVVDSFEIKDRSQEQIKPSIWPWVIKRRRQRALAAMRVRHAKEQAAFEHWRIEFLYHFDNMENAG